MPGLLQATADFHDATDEGSEVASLTAGIATGQLGTAEREAIRKLGKLAAEAAGFLSSLGTPEAQALSRWSEPAAASARGGKEP